MFYGTDLEADKREFCCGTSVAYALPISDPAVLQNCCVRYDRPEGACWQHYPMRRHG